MIDTRKLIREEALIVGDMKLNGVMEINDLYLVLPVVTHMYTSAQIHLAGYLNSVHFVVY